MYIATNTAGATPVSGPMSSFSATRLSNSATIKRGTCSCTHKYAGKMAKNMLKNRMTKHESWRPRPKATGPNVPAENLRQKRSKFNQHLSERNNTTDDRMFVFADNHKKNILLNCISFLSSNATGWIPIAHTRSAKLDSPKFDTNRELQPPKSRVSERVTADLQRDDSDSPTR